MLYGKLKNYLYILPAFALYGFLILRSIIGTFTLSLYKWTGVGPKTFVGFANFQKLFLDMRFWNCIKNNMIWTGLYMVVPLGIGLLLATLLAQKRVRGRTFFRAVYFLPCVLSFVVVGIIWGWIYHPTFGVLNAILKFLGLGFLARGWLGDSHWALYCVILTGSWTYYGFCMIILISALQNIEPLLYDAVKIDGANKLQSFWFVTLPSLKNVLTFLIILSLANSFKIFDIVYIMTKGGPYLSTEVTSLYLYNKAFLQSQIGYASSISIVLMGIVSFMAIILIKLRES